MKRLIEQTACEHGSYGAHVWNDESFIGLWPRHRCPGGSSREVEVDWTAAAKEVGMIVRGVLSRGAPTWKHDGIDSKIEGHWAGRIVGAALGGGL